MPLHHTGGEVPPGRFIRSRTGPRSPGRRAPGPTGGGRPARMAVRTDGISAMIAGADPPDRRPAILRPAVGPTDSARPGPDRRRPRPAPRSRASAARTGCELSDGRGGRGVRLTVKSRIGTAPARRGRGAARKGVGDGVRRGRSVDGRRTGGATGAPCRSRLTPGPAPMFFLVGSQHFGEVALFLLGLLQLSLVEASPLGLLPRSFRPQLLRGRSGLE
jgi:hypothetical protein